MTCDHCVAEAVVVSPGTEDVRELFLLARGTPTRCWCLACAQAAGWPWLVSETGRRPAA
jgi:hypothetical protein